MLPPPPPLLMLPGVPGPGSGPQWPSAAAGCLQRAGCCGQAGLEQTPRGRGFFGCPGVCAGIFGHKLGVPAPSAGSQFSLAANGGGGLGGRGPLGGLHGAVPLPRPGRANPRPTHTEGGGGTGGGAIMSDRGPLSAQHLQQRLGGNGERNEGTGGTPAAEPGLGVGGSAVPRRTAGEASKTSGNFGSQWLADPFGGLWEGFTGRGIAGTGGGGRRTHPEVPLRRRHERVLRRDHHLLRPRAPEAGLFGGDLGERRGAPTTPLS